MPEEKKPIQKPNPYWIPKSRYLELKTFTESYKAMKEEYNNMNCYSNQHLKQYESRKSFIDPTCNRAVLRINLDRKIKLIEEVAFAAADKNARYILLNIIEGYTYEWLKFKMGLKLSHKEFMETRYRFFWIMDKVYKK